MTKKLFLLILAGLPLFTFANKSSGELYVDLQKLHSLKRVLYIAAHPDDENTRALAWFSLAEKAETAYLSLTRGDGGQNLIGNELSENLGVLRTQELLAARSYDKAKQFFTRAVDFGYSRSADESFEKWGKDEILSDVVLVIRQFKPDVIITRFPTDGRGGHGHHTASAMLALEAFDKAADPNYLPDQVSKYGAWKTTSIYWNTSVWWDQSLDSTAEKDPNYVVKDIGTYNQQLGQSYNEIGTIARSQHKCQGFGAIIERGSRKEYFYYMGGERIENSFFEHNTNSWSELISPDFEAKMVDLLENFNFRYPDNMIPNLVEIWTELQKLPASLFKTEKLDRCTNLILDCLGLHMELLAQDFSVVSGNKISVNAEFINRSSYDIKITEIEFPDKKISIEKNNWLQENQVFNQEFTLTNNQQVSNPYWLNAAFTNLFEVNNEDHLGMAEAPAMLQGKIRFKLLGREFEITRPVIYKWRDPSYGERQRNLISTPEFTVNFDREIAVANVKSELTLQMKIHSFKDSLDDRVALIPPIGWKISPSTIPFTIPNKHGELFFEVQLTPSKKAKRGPVIIKNSNGEALKSYTEIDYDHISTRSIFKEASLECVKLDIDIEEGNIAYIKGVDDAVPQAIEQMGFPVDIYEVEDLANVKLKDYMTVVLGIRIYNVHPELSNYHEELYKYVEEGGNLIMQYNTASRSATDLKYGPIPFEISRNRVTEEDAKATILQPEHVIFNEPNAITLADFDGWVQERGLYFASNWDPAYTPLISWHDKDLDPEEGALIVAEYGKGRFIYTGISFFRELPNGVVGAYRLFANMLSYDP